MNDYLSPYVLIIALTFLLAGIVKGVTGMGLPTVAVGKRLCSLIDVLYERHVKLIVSADGDPHSIYLGMVAVFGGVIGPPSDQSDTFPELIESRRAVSRLIEMRSCDYLGLT
jgi:predicted ATPase